MSEEHRTKISNSKILNRLIACAEGEVELTSVQAQVALGLLRKVMPDLASTELSGGTDDTLTVNVPWKVNILHSTTQDLNSSHSMNGSTAGQLSSPTDEREKPLPPSLN